MGDVESIASTRNAFAAKKRDGTVVTWGIADLGGDPGSKQSQLTDVEFIASNNRAFAAKKRDGTVVTWGYEYYGGYPDAHDGGNPQTQSKLVDVILIASAERA